MAPGQYPFIGKGAERKEESSATGKKNKNKNTKVLGRQYLQLPKGQRAEISREQKKGVRPWGRL